MTEEELNARVNAMQAEYEVAISALAKRSATMAAECASWAMKDKESAKRIADLMEKIEFYKGEPKD